MVEVPAGPEPLRTNAWLIPLGTVPVALTLVCGAIGLSPRELWDESGGLIGVLAVVGLLCSVYAARIIAAAAAPGGVPATVAVLPFLAAHAAGVLATGFSLAQVFKAGTICGPRTREEVIAWELSATLVLRLAPLALSAAGVACVAVATVFVSRELETRVRWATIAATSALAWALAVESLSVAFIRRHLVELPGITADPQGTWLRPIVAHYRDYVVASNTLLLAAGVFALAAMSRRSGLRGAVTLSTVLVAAVAVRGAVLLDEAQYSTHFDEYPAFERVRAFGADDTLMRLELGPWRHTVKERLRDWSELETIHNLNPDDHRLLAESRARGVPLPWPAGLFADPEVTPMEFRRALQQLHEGGISDVLFNSPISPFPNAPRALRPLVEFQNSYDWTDPFSIRFEDEPPCVATSVKDAPWGKARRADSVWNLECETVALSQVSAPNLHELISGAASRSHRLVILVPRRSAE